MTDSAPLSVLLIAVGIVLTVVGAGMVLGGYGQMQAAQEWESKPHACDEEWNCPENPYAGGGLDVVVGLVVALLGGGAVYYGTR